MRAAAALAFLVAACGSYGDSPSTPASDGGAEGGTVCSERFIYVATNGDDANDGCDAAKPKRTLTSALGAVQAKAAASTEIHTCAETLRERVVLAYPASIVGGFACGTWAAGAGRTVIEAPDDKEVETVVAFGAAVTSSARLEHLRVVGPTRGAGYVSAVRIKDGAAPVLRDDELVGGTTAEGVAITLAVEGRSAPTIEDSVIRGGRARCTTDCTTVIASTVTLDGGAPKLRRTRIEGSEADVAEAGTSIGSVTLDVIGGAKAVGPDAFEGLEIVHGVGRVAASFPTFGLRVIGQSEIDLVGSKILPATAASTCISADCYAVAAQTTNATVRARSTRIEATSATGAAGTTNVVPRVIGLAAELGGTVDLASSFVRGDFALSASASAKVDVRASTLSGNTVVLNQGGIVALRSTLLAQRTTGSDVVLAASTCSGPSKTTLESSLIVSPAPAVIAFIEGSRTTCSVTATYPDPAKAALASSDTNQFTSTASDRTTCTGSAEACLLEVFLDAGDAKLKDGAACAIAKGGLAFPDVTTDLFGTPRTMPTSIGAFEYDGACSNGS